MISTKNITFKGLKKLSVADRMKLIHQSDFGQRAMQALTPTQIAELFPKYFLRQLPDVGVLVSQTAQQRQVAQQKFQEAIQTATVEKQEGGAGGILTKIKRKLGFDTATVHKPGEAPAPTLSPEDLMTYHGIQNQPLAMNDPKAKFLSALSSEQLKAGGLEKYRDDKTGQEFIRYVPIEVSEEEIKKAFRKTSIEKPSKSI